MDEAYVDLSDSPAPKTRARQIKRDVLAETGLTCSIGLGPNRLIAKIASDLDKPDGLCVLPRERFLEVVGERPARIIPGVGPRTEERLEALEIQTRRRPRRRTREQPRGDPRAQPRALARPSRLRLRQHRGRGRARAQVGEPRAHVRQRPDRPDADAARGRGDGADRRRAPRRAGDPRPDGDAEDPPRAVSHLHPLADACRADRRPGTGRRRRRRRSSTPSSATLRSACSASGSRTSCATASTAKAPPPAAPMRRLGRGPCNSPSAERPDGREAQRSTRIVPIPPKPSLVLTASVRSNSRPAT